MDDGTIYELVRNRIATLQGEEFQHFCDRLLITLYPHEYTPVRAGGKHGDMKNDGYCFESRKFFQAHASRGEQISKIRKKIKNDLDGCLEKQRDVKEFIYMTNDTLVGEIQKFVDNLRTEHPGIRIETWGPKLIAAKIKDMELKDIEFIVDLNLASLPENEEKDYGIIAEIFDYIFEEIIKDNHRFRDAIPDREVLLQLQTKIEINFDESNRMMVARTFRNNWSRKTLVEKFVNLQMEIDESRIDALIDRLQNDYCIDAGVKDCHSPMEDFEFIEKLALRYIPGKKRTNPEYIANARAILLFFFEFCDIGMLTEDEKSEKDHYPLFPGFGV